MIETPQPNETVLICGAEGHVLPPLLQGRELPLRGTVVGPAEGRTDLFTVRIDGEKEFPNYQLHRAQLVAENDKPEYPTGDEVCKVPPEGWRCTRKAGHDGPCAAFPIAGPAAGSGDEVEEPAYPAELLEDLAKALAHRVRGEDREIADLLDRYCAEVGREQCPDVVWQAMSKAAGA